MSLWILDTDSVSLFQRGNLEIARRLNIVDPSEISITIVTVEEQLRGRFQVIRRAAANDLVLPYNKLQVTFDSLKSFNILRFTPEAQELYTNLINQKIKVGRQDLRIAAIALSVDGILVTRQYLSVKGKRGRGKGKEKTFNLYPLTFSPNPMPS